MGWSRSRSSISRRWIWRQVVRRRDKRRQEVERRETLCASLRASQNEPSGQPRMQTNTCASPRSRNACQNIRRATWYENLQGKSRRPKQRCTLCASLRGRNAMKRMSKCQKSHFVQKFTGKMPGPRTAITLCASLRRLQEKCRRPEWAPWSSTGLYSHSKNPSVWTHCLGKNTRPMDRWSTIQMIKWKAAVTMVQTQWPAVGKKIMSQLTLNIQCMQP